VPNINVGWIAPSDVRFIINKRFKEEGIEIPFRQMVIHQGSSVANRTETQFYAKKQEVKDAD
jgi:small-conductance mechanosensitive channel